MSDIDDQMDSEDDKGNKLIFCSECFDKETSNP